MALLKVVSHGCNKICLESLTQIYVRRIF